MMDRGHSIERCQSGLSAATALVVGAKAGERKQWVARERYWEEQLAYAKKRVPNAEIIRR